jgi:hypothetical protein
MLGWQAIVSERSNDLQLDGPLPRGKQIWRSFRGHRLVPRILSPKLCDREGHSLRLTKGANTRVEGLMSISAAVRNKKSVGEVAYDLV